MENTNIATELMIEVLQAKINRLATKLNDDVASLKGELNLLTSKTDTAVKKRIKHKKALTKMVVTK